MLRICWEVTGTGQWDGLHAFPNFRVEAGSGIIWLDIETARIWDGCQSIAVSGPELGDWTFPKD